MNKLLFIAVAAAALAACDNSNSANVSASGDTNAAEANTAAIVLPPSIAASKIYRCSGDNSVIYIDWYSDGSARVKSSRTDVGTLIPAPAEVAEPTLEGSAEAPPVESPLKGTAQGSSVTYEGKTCNA